MGQPLHPILESAPQVTQEALQHNTIASDYYFDDNAAGDLMSAEWMMNASDMTWLSSFPFLDPSGNDYT